MYRRREVSQDYALRHREYGSAVTLLDPSTELERLWNLLNDLSTQLSANRQQTEQLHKRAEDLKTQAIHSQTGFTLRRFNTDVSKEEFESELERLNVTLVLENQALLHENRQLSALLKDYEVTLETVMGKFRSHAHSTQQHHLDLVRHYDSLMLNSPNPTSTSPDSSDPPSVDPLHLSLSLAHLASLIRKAMRSLQGENPENEHSPVLDIGDLHTSEVPQGRDGTARSFRDESEGGYIGRSASTEPHHTTLSADVVLPGTRSVHSSSIDSYTGTAIAITTGDDALEREIELEALRRENEELRTLLGIAGDDGAPP